MRRPGLSRGQKPRASAAVLLGVVAVLGSLVTLGARQLGLGYAAEDLEVRRQEVISNARTTIRADFVERTARLEALASEVASDARVRASLAEWSERTPEAERDLVAVAESFDVAEGSALEFYDPVPRLVAWSGFDMPMDEGPEEMTFLDRPVLRLARDADHRAALALWWPVERDGKTVGVVRAMSLVLARMPLRNEYLRDVSLGDDWSRDTGLIVRVDLGVTDLMPAALGRPRDALAGPDGSVLATFEVVAPTDEQLLRAQREWYDRVLAAWATLGLSVLLWVVGAWAIRNPGTGSVTGFAATGIATRYLLIFMDVPARWQTGKSPLAPLFDSSHLASSWGGGIAASIGDLAVTALIAACIAFHSLRVVARTPERNSERPGGVGHFAGVLYGFSGLILYGGVAGLALHALQDSTLQYFGRSGLLPQRLVIAVFASLLVVLLAALVVQIALTRVFPLRRHTRAEGARLSWGPAAIAAAGVVILGSFLLKWPLGEGVGALGFTLISGWIGIHASSTDREAIELFTLRPMLLAAVVLAITLFPVLDRALEVDRRSRMEDAAISYAQDRDPRVLLAMEVLLRDGRGAVERAFESSQSPDSVLSVLVSRSLLSALGTYEVSASWLLESDPAGTRYAAARSSAAASSLSKRDREDLALFLAMGAGGSEPLVEKITSPVEQESFDYVGVLGAADGWLLVRASQHAHMPAGSLPFPRVLVPSGYFGSRYPELSVAEFRDGILNRSVGQAFGRSVLDRSVTSALATEARVWRGETVRKQSYLTLYVRQTDLEDWSDPSPRFRRDVVAVRQAAVSVFDRLYYLLRLTVSGLLVAVPLYLIGLVVRRRAGLLPAPRLRFRDRVLNAFLGVGLIAVGAMGALGLRVVTDENDRAVDSWLRQHLDRVEYALARSAVGTEMPYRVLERTNIDSLAVEVGLDLNVFRGFELEASSRPQLVRDRLVNRRLPIEAYQSLFIDGFKFATVDETLGRFAYTAGYRALADEQGVPRFVVSVPTLPEQERIEEERARTIAYLFGALLLLLLTVMATAGVIANALALPVQRLKKGLDSVAEGRFERVGELNTRDELGELVGSFNAMQDQLAESRRLLAGQERQLAWREMARQVAHEIKNPLTPMKLSVQHLRRAFAGQKEDRFTELFGRITGTLIEQIDALALIADEFSSFARMPQPKLEPLDLNDVIEEAVALMQEHITARVSMELDSAPLEVMGDREALRRMYINFIKNAIEAMPQGGGGSIHVRSRREADPESGLVWVVSEVEDNGLGIPPELRDRIFNPAFSTKTSGTGLGLAISKSTVEALQGRIGFDSPEGGGTVFWVRLPASSDGGGPV